MGARKKIRRLQGSHASAHLVAAGWRCDVDGRGGVSKCHSRSTAGCWLLRLFDQADLRHESGMALVEREGYKESRQWRPAGERSAIHVRSAQGERVKRRSHLFGDQEHRQTRAVEATRR